MAEKYRPEKSTEKAAQDAAGSGAVRAGKGNAAGSITIDPPKNEFTFNPQDTTDESIVVTLGGAGFKNVRLVPSATIAPFVTSIDPPNGFDNPAGDAPLTFRVRWHGIPCKPEEQIIQGSLDVVADGRVIASKPVLIKVPACPAQETDFVYAVKFICGEQPECGCDCAPVQPGRYATEINIHNTNRREVVVRKRFIPVVLAGAPMGREPRVAAPRAEDKIALPPLSATMDDCCRIAQLLFGGEPPSPIPLTIGFLEITAGAPLAVTAVYTASGLNGGGVSIDVEQIAGRRVETDPTRPNG